jgi:hypothetical protein
MPLYFEGIFKYLPIPLLTISFSFNDKLEINAIKIYFLVISFDNHPQNVLPQTISRTPIA